MNRMWSVLTIPYFVLTVVPSTIGRMSRCTPSRLTSGPWLPSRPATLSISSMKMMPGLLHPVDRGAGDRLHVDQLLFFFLRQRVRAPRESRIRRFFMRPWKSPGSMSLTLMSTSSTDEPAMISNEGKLFSRTSISTVF